MRRLLTLSLLFAPLPLVAQDTTLATRSKGQVTAPVTVYEMSDFQCPYCRRFFLEVWPTLDKEYVATGKVRWVFINFPLTTIHRNAAAAAEFAVCASRQNKFWPAHDMLYLQQETWTPLSDPGTFFMSKVADLKLDRAAMQRCIDDGSAQALVRSDAQGSQRSGAKSTPSFYVEGGMMEGILPITAWRQVLDSIIRVKSTRKP